MTASVARPVLTIGNAPAANAPAVNAAPADADAEQLDTLAQAVDAAITEVRGMPIEHRKRAFALQEAVEGFHKAGLVAIVRHLKADPRGKELLLELAENRAVYALLAMHGIVRADLATRVARVIEGVRPYTQSHGGDVQLVEVRDNTVYVRMNGSCSGCSMSAVTLRNGVEEALREQCPEITAIEVLPTEPPADAPALVSLQRAAPNNGWVAGPALETIIEGEPAVMTLDDGRSVVLIRIGDDVQAFYNVCAHLGMPIDGGMVNVADRTITCPWHGFRFDCTTGECLTAPQAQLEGLPLRVERGIIMVRPT